MSLKRFKINWVWTLGWRPARHCVLQSAAMLAETNQIATGLARRQDNGEIT